LERVEAGALKKDADRKGWGKKAGILPPGFIDGRG